MSQKKRFNSTDLELKNCVVSVIKMVENPFINSPNLNPYLHEHRGKLNPAGGDVVERHLREVLVISDLRAKCSHEECVELGLLQCQQSIISGDLFKKQDCFKNDKKCICSSHLMQLQFKRIELRPGVLGFL